MPRDDENCLYLLDTDASNFGASAVLQQWQDGELRVIEYASRTFNTAERAYCTTRKEMAALIFGLKQYRCYLLGRHFQVRVDHAAVTFYKNMKDAQGQAARLIAYIMSFDFKVVYRPGLRHGNADSLSRLRPCEIDEGEPCRQCNKRITGRHNVTDHPNSSGRLCFIQTVDDGGDLGASVMAMRSVLTPPFVRMPLTTTNHAEE